MTCFRRDAALLLLGFLTARPAAAQTPPVPCCGPITENGRRLARFLDHTGVDHLWQAGWHVDWETGAINRSHPGGPEAATHCSAFVAAIAERLGIYVLRPPQHPQELLANAQMGWLRERGAGRGWKELENAEQAQALANQGQLVLASFESPDPRRPGHIAIVRPSEKPLPELERDGPQITQAGERNYLSTTMRNGFRHHRGAWKPGGGAARFFAHPIAWPTV